MIRRFKCAASLQAALIAVTVFMLCSAGRTQSVSVTYPADGMTFSSAYIGVQTKIIGFARVTSAQVTVKDSAGHAFRYVLDSYDAPYRPVCATSPLIPRGATFYNGPVTLQVSVTGTKPGSPAPITVSSQEVACTVQIGYVLGAGSLNTATVVTPLDGTTVQSNGKPFLIESDYRWDFFRYDSFGTYKPTLRMQLLTSFPKAAGYKPVAEQTVAWELPKQPGDVYRDFNLMHTETYSPNSKGSVGLPFVSKAMSFYPFDNPIPSGFTTATALYPKRL